ncbi:MAG: Holliday junction branch migration protein RuvA [Clostridia bacterium]|nr:Holliday junction branch migration protein RuvA [Clostridia bacterium]
MYAFISGTLEYAGNGYVILDNNGIGYRIHVPASVLSKLPSIGKLVKLYTYHHVREDAMELFGFLSMDDKEIYEVLISVSGVGPKVGLAILSAVEPNALITAVLSGDVKTITKAPGVGPKLAQRVILELKDKFKGFGVEGVVLQSEPETASVNNEAIEALTALGYTQSEAAKAVVGLEGTVEQIVGAALRNLMRNR